MLRPYFLILALAWTPFAVASTVIVKRDSLYGLAQQRSLSSEALLAANPEIHPQLAQKVGQVVQLSPSCAGTRPTPVSGPAVLAASVRVTAVLPLQGQLTSPFSADHRGLDLAAPTGEPVRAALAGQVTESRFDARNGWGWTVVINHGSGLRTRYSHQSALVRVGELAAVGQVIGRVDNTGHSAGPHLDFCVLRDSVAIDPLSLY